MLYSKNVKEILDHGKHIFQDMHNVFGFDFEKPHKVLRIVGSFTINSVNKMIATEGFTEKAVKVVLLRGWRKEELDAVRIFRNDFEIEFKGYGKEYGKKLFWCDSFDTFCTKGSFNEYRKVSETAFVIVQEPEYISIPKQETLDKTIRYRKIETEYSYIYAYSFSGRKITVQEPPRFSYSGQKKITAEDMFDKSGYFVLDRRAEWIQKAKQLRADRAKAEYSKTDNSDKIISLEQAIEKRKAELVEMLSSAKTPDDFHNVAKAIGEAWYCNGFASAVRHFEEFKTKTEQKAYTSIADSEKAYNNIMDELTAGECA